MCIPRHSLGEGKPILQRMDNGEYFPLTRYRCELCGEEVIGDGIWWTFQGIPADVIFEPEPEGEEIIVDLGFAKLKMVRL